MSNGPNQDCQSLTGLKWSGLSKVSRCQKLPLALARKELTYLRFKTMLPSIILFCAFQHPVAIKELKRLKIVIEALRDQV